MASFARLVLAADKAQQLTIELGRYCDFLRSRGLIGTAVWFHFVDS